MGMKQAADESASRSVTVVERVLQCYVIVGLVSTSGVDVLLVITVLFLLFASLRQSVLLLGTGLRSLGRTEAGPTAVAS
jgi:hypothetical protein